MRRSATINVSVLVALCACVMAADAFARIQDGQQSPPKRQTDRVTDQPQDRGRRGQQARRDEVAIPPGVQFVPDVVYATATSDDGEDVELLMDVAFLKESGDDPMPVIVYIHGGGFRAGSRKQWVAFAVAAAQGGYLGVTIDYRLAGVAKFPAAVHDCKAAVRFLRANADELGIDPERIGVWGHSAGGHLSAIVATSGNNPEIEGDVGTTDVSSAVACAATVAAPTDFIRMAATPQRATIENWFGRPAEGNEELFRSGSPMRYLDAHDPPLLIVHGTEDDVIPFEQAELFRDAAAEHDVAVEFMPVEGAGHGIGSQPTLRRIAAFLDQHLDGSFADALARMRRGRVTDRDDRIRDRR